MYVGLCMNDVIDCDRVKVPGNTVEVVTGHAVPVQHGDGTLGKTRATLNTFELCDRDPKMGITAETLPGTTCALCGWQEMCCQTLENFVLFTLHFSRGTLECGSRAELFHSPRCR